jgi:hypothetical protein
MKVRNVAIAGAISLAAAALSSPAYASTQHHHPAPPPPSHSRPDRCSLAVNNPRPHAGGAETLAVETDAGRSVVQVQINYKTVSHVWALQTNRNGLAYHAFNVGNPTPRRPVTLVGEVIAAPPGYRAGATCYTSFIPR